MNVLLGKVAAGVMCDIYIYIYIFFLPRRFQTAIIM